MAVAKVTKVGISDGPFPLQCKIEFTVGDETFVAVIKPGQDVKQRMIKAVAEAHNMREYVITATKQLQALKTLEGQEIDIAEENTIPLEEKEIDPE